MNRHEADVFERHQWLADQTAAALWKSPRILRIGGFDDCRQSAYLGLLEAIQFAENNPVDNFEAFARVCIRIAIINAADDSALIRIPSSLVSAALSYKRSGVAPAGYKTETLNQALNVLSPVLLEDLDRIPSQEAPLEDCPETATTVSERVRDAIQCLGQHEREVIEMAYGIGQPKWRTHQIADVMGISKRGVERLLRKAKQHLREVINGDQGDRTGPADGDE